MYINSLELNSFRNYESQKVEFCNGINLILGDNGHGKTNIIEAIYISSYAKSFRTQRDTEMIRFDCDRFKTRLDFCRNLKDAEIETVEMSINKLKEKRIRLNGVPLNKLQDIIGEVVIVLFSPEDMKLVKDAPSERRRFLDREISAVSKLYYSKIIEYNRILSQRNNLLKLIETGKADVLQLEVWNENLANTASYIMKKRKQFIDKLRNYAVQINNEMTGNRDFLEIEYNTSVYFHNDECEQRKYIIKSLEDSLERDLFKGHTGKGPHKDDIIFKVNGKDLKTYGSQGQKRTSVLAVKFAQTKLIKEIKGYYPVLLLDDVLSELDKNRQHDIVKYASNIQTIIASADINSELLDKLKKMNAVKFKKIFIDDGKIIESQI